MHNIDARLREKSAGTLNRKSITPIFVQLATLVEWRKKRIIFRANKDEILRYPERIFNSFT